MKRKLTLLICLATIILAYFVISEAMIDNIGDKSDYEDSKSKGSIDYKEIKDREIVGFENSWKQVEHNSTYCNYSFPDEKIRELINVEISGFGGVNFSGEELNCENRFYNVTEVDPKVQGDPIYRYSEIKAIEYSGDNYDFQTKGCFVCEHILREDNGQTWNGKLLLCLSDRDGYGVGRSDHLKCVFTRGESIKIINLESGKVIYEDISNGVKIE